jgi:hypothetical protein
MQPFLLRLFSLSFPSRLKPDEVIRESLIHVEVIARHFRAQSSNGRKRTKLTLSSFVPVSEPGDSNNKAGVPGIALQLLT